MQSILLLHILFVEFYTRDLAPNFCFTGTTQCSKNKIYKYWVLTAELCRWNRNWETALLCYQGWNYITKIEKSGIWWKNRSLLAQVLYKMLLIAEQKHTKITSANLKKKTNMYKVILFIKSFIDFSSAWFETFLGHIRFLVRSRLVYWIGRNIVWDNENLFIS